MPLLGKYLCPGTQRPTIRAKSRLDGSDVMRARGDWKRLLALEVSAFGFFGLFWGCFAVLLADLSGALSLSPGPLGVALFVGAGASIGAMAALGWASDRLGRRAYLILAACAFGTGIAGLALSGSYATLLATLVVLYSSSGLYDVGINAVAVDLERLSGRRFMSYLHAAFSGGAMAGAVGAGALRQAGVDYRLVYLALLLPLASLVAAFTAVRFPSPGTEGTRDERSPGGTSPATDSGGEGGAGRWALYRDRSLLLVAAIACLGLLAEGEMEHWSGIYLRDTLGLAAIVGGSGVAVFYGAQALGRLAIGYRRARRQSPHAARLGTAGGGRDAARARHDEPRARCGRIPARGPCARGGRAPGLLGGRGDGARQSRVGGLGRDHIRLRGLPAGAAACRGPGGR